MGNVLKGKDGSIHIDNINIGLLTKVVDRMKQKESGFSVCRQFVYDTPYTMLLTDVKSELGSDKVMVTVVLWTDENDSNNYVTREIPFYLKPGNLHVWEDFCEAVSDGKAIFENDLLGNFFVGRIVQNKAYYDKKLTCFEKILVDKFIGRLDLNKAKDIVDSKKEKKSTVMKKTKSKISILLADDDNADDDFE